MNSRFYGCDPSRVAGFRFRIRMDSGGGAVRDPRLIACIPPGCFKPRPGNYR